MTVSHARAASILNQFLRDHQRLTILTGAGISTGSGIPDYRGPTGIYSRQPDYKPITYQQFTESAHFRSRYWARGFLGWEKMNGARPNRVHEAVTRWMQHVPGTYLITQNVDSLHLKSGAQLQSTIELHGRLRDVICLSCGWLIDRNLYQQELEYLNPEWEELRQQQAERQELSQRPDGDMDSGTLDTSKFKYPHCPHCSTSAYFSWNVDIKEHMHRSDEFSQHEYRRRAGTEFRAMLKPAVTFFGEALHPSMRERAHQFVAQSDGLLVLGSSLRMYSAYSLVHYKAGQAHHHRLHHHHHNHPCLTNDEARDTPSSVLILTMGETRADPLRGIQKLPVRCDDVLPEAVDQLIQSSIK